MRRWIAFGALSTIACGPLFYQAPPSIGAYPERVATKSWQELFLSSSPADPRLPDDAALARACRELATELRPLDPAARLAHIDRLLSENRSSTYTSERANFLHEARELAADPANFETTADYITRRAKSSFAIPRRPPANKPWDMEQGEFDRLQNAFRTSLDAAYEYFRSEIERAPDLLRPYWKIRRAAFIRLNGSPTEAIAAFDEVARDYPKHPRGEVALLMRAVVRFERARTDHRHALSVGNEFSKLSTDEAETMLHDFIALHPDGRFTPDAWGWLAAISFEHRRYGEAVDRQIKRLELQPTREITRSVVRECDAIFGRLFEECENTGESDLWLDPRTQLNPSTVARHPLIARVFLQHALDPAAAAMISKNWYDNESADRWRIRFLNQRVFQSRPLVRIALEQLGAAMLRQSESPDRTTLLLLAWAATSNNEHDQALGLLNRIAGEPDDETLHARAIILQRLGRHPEAVTAFDTLETSFPDSPLANDLRQRRAISQLRSGEAGKAAAAFMPSSRDDGKPRSTLRLDFESPQWCDTILQFAPLGELEDAWQDLPEGSAEKTLLAAALRTRHLARHDFTNAKRFLTTGAPAGFDDGSGAYSETGALHLDEDGWNKHVAPLETLGRNLADETDPETRLRLHLELGRAWMERRGHVTLPALLLFQFANSEPEKQELLRRHNGVEMGYDRRAVNEELDLRDEAAHALKHFLAAAGSSDPKTGAPALELANESLFRLAEFSRYQQSRALETGATELSRDLREQLRTRFPATREAIRAVSYVFFTEPGPWMPGDYNPSNALSQIVREIHGGSAPADTASSQGAELPMDPTLPLADIRRELIAERAKLLASRRDNGEFQPGRLDDLNRLDDRIAATTLPGITREDFLNYIAGRYDVLPPVFAGFVEFRRRVGAPGEWHPPFDTFADWEEFLRLHPDGPKTEAASLRRIRALAREFRHRIRVSAYDFPEAPIPNGYKKVAWRNERPNDPARLLDLIREHETRFPEGRYRSDLNLWKSGALIDLGRISDATSLLTAILGDPHQPDLHPEAALYFCDICQRLHDPGQRVVTAAALHENPDSLAILRKLVNGDTYLSRLRPLMAWIEEK